MSILIGLAVLIVFALLVARFAFPYGGLGEVSACAAFLLAVVLGIAALLIPLSRMGYRGEIAEFNAVRDSRNASAPEIEAAAWRMKVAESNAWLASTRYYNHTVFDLWIPDEVDSLQPIQ